MSARKARQVLDYIRQNAPIETLSEITSINGIGPAMLESSRAAGFCEIVSGARQKRRLP